MADYQAFERDYPTLNKFVGAAREAASVIPGAGYLTPGGQQYQDARTRFQQENPMAAAAGRGVGYGVDMAAAGGALGALGRVAAGRGAAAAAEEAMAAGGQATRGSTFSALAGQAAREQAPAFVPPTLSNLMTGAGQAATMAGPALSTAAGYGRTAMNYAPMAAPVLGPMVAQAMRGNGAQSAPASAPASAGPRANAFEGSAGAFTPAAVRHMTSDQAAAQMSAVPSAPQQSASALDTPMFPGDDPRQSLRVRLLLAKLSPRPHYATANDRVMNTALSALREDYTRGLERDPDETARTKRQSDYLANLLGLAKGGAYATAAAYRTPATAYDAD